MIPSHLCLDCEVAWRHHDHHSPCWNCGQPRPRGGLAELIRRVGRGHVGWDHHEVTGGAA